MSSKIGDCPTCLGYGSLWGTGTECLDCNGYGTANSKPRTGIIKATDPLETCDQCEHQEGRHYCLMHGKQMRDMDCYTCESFSENK